MWKLLRRRILYYFQFVPITRNTLLCGLAVWVLYRIVYDRAPQQAQAIELADDAGTWSAFQPFVLLMAKMALLLVLLLAALSVFSAMLAWLRFLWLRHRQRASLQLQFSTETKQGHSNRVFLNAALEGAFRPLLGFVRGRLFYDDFRLSDKFSLLSRRRRADPQMRPALAGRSRLMLPDIREYQLQGGFVFFEDMLRLFSFPVAQPVSGSFYQPPVLCEAELLDAAPRKTETTDVRINQMRRVEGDYLNYKDFESGDDVRRIVWKVYAKSGDLVVRVPERFEPYASHLYFYASFHTALHEAWLSGGFAAEMLNFYKNSIWTVYEALARKEWRIRFVPDQKLHLPEDLEERERVGRIISGSSWQKDKDLASYFNTRTGTVLVVSSLSDPKELAQLLEGADAGLVIYFVKLSRTFRHFAAWSWFKRLLFLPPKDRLSRLKDRWTFSPLRSRMHRREREIQTVLSKSGASWQVLR
ncbi:MAG: DUF58 domain-containing protein [Bacteroidetes bacterium]|nr:DUF58 domain-containing protein [Bacteroidota bacterium]